MWVEIDDNGYIIGYASTLSEDAKIQGIVKLDSVPTDFYDDFSHYRYIEGALVKQENYISDLDKQTIRENRTRICFPIINRGQLWYDTLTDEQRNELSVWYQEWLDAPQTGVEPNSPEWI